jgi:uncharacterized protein (TIGR00369 family)
MDDLEKLGFILLPAFSPFVKHNGPLYFRLTPQDRFELGMKIEADHINPLKACHGGMMMTLVDSAMGGMISYAAEPQKMTPTVSFNCNFIRSAMLGDSVIARAEVARCTSSLAFATCTVHVTSHPDSPIVTANGIYALPQNATPGFNMQTAMRQAYARTSAAAPPAT